MLMLGKRSTVDADEEDGYATPKYLDMTYCMIKYGYILYQNTQQNECKRQKPISGLSADESHVIRCEHIHHEYGGDKPEFPGIALPETPTYEDVGDGIAQSMGEPGVMDIGIDIEISCHTKPDGIDA